MNKFLQSINSLSPEEADQFRADLDQDEALYNQVQGQIDKMNSAEKEQFKAFVYNQPVQTEEIPEAQEVSQEREMLEKSAEGEYTGTITENIHGMAQAAVSQLPFGEKILAAGEAAYDVATGQAPSLKEAYANNMVENIEQTKEFSEEHPVLDVGARAVSEIGQLWAGGAALKGGIKALGMTDKVSKAGRAVSAVPFLGKMAPKYGQVAIVEGALQTVRDLDMESKVTLQEGVTTLGGNLALAATFGKLGDLGESALKGVANRIISTPAGAQLATMKENLVKNISTFTLDNTIHKINKFVSESKNTLNPHIKIQSDREYFKLIEDAYSESGVLNEVVEAYGKKDINNAINVGKKAFDYVEQLRDGALNRLHKLGKTPESVITQKEVMDLGNLFVDSIDSGNLSNQASLTLKPIVDKIQGMGNKTGADLYSFVNASNYAKMPGSIKPAIDKAVKLDPSLKGGIEKFLMEARKMAYDKMEDAALVAYKQGDDQALVSFNNFVKYNKMNRVLDHNLNQIVTEGQKELFAAELGRSSLSSAVHKTLNDLRKEVALIGWGGGLAGGVAVASGMVSLPVAGGISTAYLGRKLIKHLNNAPEKVAKVGRKVIRGMAAEGDNTARELNKFYDLAGFLEKTEKLPIVQTAVTSFLNASRAIPEHERFEELYSTAKAASHFASNPLERNTASVIANREAITDLLKYKAPDLLMQLNKNIDSGEDIGPIMDVILKMPQAAPLVKDGVGFEGKVYSEEDKAALEKELVNNLFVPGDYKVQMVKALREQGIVPDLNAVPKRQPRKYEKRNKRRPY